MTAAERKLIEANLRRRAYAQPQVDPYQDAAIIGEKVRKSSCFGAVVTGVVILLAGLAAMVFGAGKRDKPQCTCLEYIGDNPPCPVHGDPHKEARDQERKKREASNEKR